MLPEGMLPEDLVLGLKPEGLAAPSARADAAPMTPAPQPVAAAAGYVFHCRNHTQAEALRIGILGAPLKDFGQMLSTIFEDTQLFLFNAESQALIGRFMAVGPPEQDISREAFGGMFGAQVRVTPFDLQPLEVTVGRRLPAGPKSAAEVEALKGELRQGRPVSVPQKRARGASAPQRARPGGLQPQAAGSATEDVCWQFKKGRCPRGDKCRYLHGGGMNAVAAPGARNALMAPGFGPFAPAAAAAYVFTCNNATQRECQSLRVLGSPDRELDQMRACIKPLTELFLLNFETLQLFGPFVANGLPGMKIVPGAFGGRFNAQVSVRPLDSCVWEVSLDRRIPSGPKTPEELRGLEQRFQQGRAAGPEVQLAWSLAPILLAGAERQPPAKRRRRQDAPRPRPDALKSEGGDSDAGEVDVDKDPKSNVCWDFVAGECPRGEKCKYKHLEGNAAGYVFLCSNSTQRDCEAHHLLGSPAKELAQMKHCITDETQLFLLNFQSLTLTGAFTVAALPDRHVEPEAFSNKFSAQVRVAPLDIPLMQVKLTQRIPSGPKTASEVEELRASLGEGGAAAPDVQEAWEVAVA